MKIATQYVVAKFALAAACGVSLAGHNHISVDTVSAPDQIVIRAGYYPSEAGFAVQGGRLYLNGQVAVYDVVEQLTQAGELSGWYAGDELLLTSDFYFATGRLDGGNFLYELAGVVNVDGGEPAMLVWGDFGSAGAFEPLAHSDAQSRVERSFDTRIAGHDHEQGYAFSSPGLYDVTLVAWDSNGLYAASTPLTIRFRVGVPACNPDVNQDGNVDQGDIDYLINVVAGAENFTGVDPDFNQDGNADQGDVDALLNVVAGGECP